MFQNPDDQIIFLTVVELALSLQAGGLARKPAQAQARAWLEGGRLGAWADLAAGSPSQGQRQSVCWLAPLIASHSVLLLDETFASLDQPGQVHGLIYGLRDGILRDLGLSAESLAQAQVARARFLRSLRLPNAEQALTGDIAL